MTGARSRIRSSSVGSIPKTVIQPAGITSPAPSNSHDRTSLADRLREGGAEADMEDVGSEHSLDVPVFEPAQITDEIHINGLEPLADVVAPAPVPAPAGNVPVLPLRRAVAMIAEPVDPEAAMLQQVRQNVLPSIQNKLRRDSRLIIEDCQEFIEINEHVVMNSVTLEFIDREAKGLIS